MNMFRRKREERLPEDVQIQEIEERHDLAQQVFFRREGAGMTQERLADAAGMTQAQIAQIEAGHANPTHRTLVKLAAALGCRVRDLYAPLVDAAHQERSAVIPPEEEFGRGANRAITKVVLGYGHTVGAELTLRRGDFQEDAWRPGNRPAVGIESSTNAALAVAS